MTSINELEQRLAALEEQCTHHGRRARRFQHLAIGLALLLMGGVGMAMNQSIRDVVRTHKLLILDDDGRPVMQAAAGAHGGQLDIYTSDETTNVLRLSVNSDGGDMAMWNTQGVNVFGAFTTPTGGEAAIWNAMGQRMTRMHGDDLGGRVDVHNPADAPVASLRGAPAGGRLDLFNQEGGLAIDLTSSELGGAVTVHNTAGSPVVMADVDQAGAGLLLVADPTGLPRAHTGVTTRGGVTKFLNQEGKTVALLGASAEHAAGALHLYNAAGGRVCTLFSESDGCGRMDLLLDSGSTVFSVDGVTGTGASLSMLNPSGRKVFGVGTRPHGGLLNVMNAMGNPVVIAGTGFDERSGALSVSNGRGTQVVCLGVSETEDGELTILDADGRSSNTLDHHSPDW